MTPLLYVNPRWIKQPFLIPYPPSSSIIQKSQSLNQFLFENHKQNSNWIKNEFDIDESIINSNLESLYTQPKPQKLLGKHLFFHQYSYLSRLNTPYPDKYWTHLDPDIKAIFYNHNYINNAFTNEIRIWKGFEVVQFLKKFLGMNFNPYLVLGLYPWEIILHKLSQRGKKNKNKKTQKWLPFHYDYYDLIIEEAFLPRARNWAQFLYTETKNEAMEPCSGSGFKKLLTTLSPQQKNHFLIKQQNHLHHIKLLKTKPQPLQSVYKSFLSDFLHKNYPQLKTVAEMGPAQKHAAQVWRQLSPQQQNQFRTASTKGLGRNVVNQWQYLHWRLSLVMHYIYDVGGVSPLYSDNAGFNWRHDLNVKLPHYYVNRHYLEKYLYFDRNRILWE